MIIQCDDCQTRFRIGDEKVTSRGVRVRCTRCGHTFVVRRPEAEPPPEPTPPPPEPPEPAPQPGAEPEPGWGDVPGLPGDLADSLFGDLDLEEGAAGRRDGRPDDDEVDAALSDLGSAPGAPPLPAPPADPYEAGDFGGDPGVFSGFGIEAPDASTGWSAPVESPEPDDASAAFLRESDALLDPGASADDPGAPAFDWGEPDGDGLALTDDYDPPGGAAEPGTGSLPGDDDPFADLDLAAPPAATTLPPDPGLAALADREAPGERDAPPPRSGTATSARTPLSGGTPPLTGTGVTGTAPQAADAPRRPVWPMLLANGLFGLALVVVALGAWVAHRTGGRIDANLLEPERVVEAFQDPARPAWQVSEVASGLYATRTGEPVLIVRGRLGRRTGSDWPVVRVRVVDGSEATLAEGEAVAGGRLTPEAVWAADPTDLAPLRAQALSGRPEAPGASEPFVAVLTPPAGGLDGARIRVDVGPTGADGVAR